MEAFMYEQPELAENFELVRPCYYYLFPEKTTLEDAWLTIGLQCYVGSLHVQCARPFSKGA